MLRKFVSQVKYKLVNRTSFIPRFVFRHQFSKSGNHEDIIRSPYPDIQLKDRSIAELLLERFPTYGNNIALEEATTGKQIRYDKLTDLVLKTSAFCKKVGIKEGSIVTILSPNCIEFPIVTLAVLLQGAILSPVNYVYTTEELKNALNLSSSSHMFTSEDAFPIVRNILPSCPKVKNVILLDGEHESYPVLSKIWNEQELPDYEVSSIDPSNVALIPFSSGTTGVPKGVLLTHRNIASNLQQMEKENIIAYERSDTILSVLPFFHVYGFVIIMLCGLLSGAKQVIMQKFSPALFLDTIQKYKCTYIPLVPPILQFMSTQTSSAPFDSIRNIVVGGAPSSLEIIHGSINKMPKGVILRQAYGLTESGPLSLLNLPNHNKHHSVGLPLPNTCYKIIDVDTGKTVPRGKPGELCLKGPQTMKGYLNNINATKEILSDDGWLRTGDLCYADEDGYGVVVDRIKEMIKVQGFQVAPAELEALLLTHPCVLDAAVTRVPHKDYGEAPKAYVVLKPDTRVSEEELKSFVQKHVAPFKKVHYMTFVKEIPKSPSGKILRKNLKDLNVV